MAETSGGKKEIFKPEAGEIVIHTKDGLLYRAFLSDKTRGREWPDEKKFELWSLQTLAEHEALSAFAAEIYWHNWFIIRHYGLGGTDSDMSAACRHERASGKVARINGKKHEMRMTELSKLAERFKICIQPEPDRGRYKPIEKANPDEFRQANDIEFMLGEFFSLAAEINIVSLVINAQSDTYMRNEHVTEEYLIKGIKSGALPWINFMQEQSMKRRNEYIRRKLDNNVCGLFTQEQQDLEGRLQTYIVDTNLSLLLHLEGMLADKLLDWKLELVEYMNIKRYQGIQSEVWKELGNLGREINSFRAYVMNILSPPTDIRKTSEDAYLEKRRDARDLLEVALRKYELGLPIVTSSFNSVMDSARKYGINVRSVYANLWSNKDGCP